MGYSDANLYNNHITTEILSAYIDGEVTGEESADVERHVARCQQCSAELASLRWTVELLHEVPALPVPRSFVVRAVDVAPEPGPRRLTIPGWLVNGLQWATVATATVALLVFAFDFLTPGKSPSMAMKALEAPQPEFESAPMAEEMAEESAPERVEPAGRMVETPAVQGEVQALRAPPQADGEAAAAVEDRETAQVPATLRQRLRPVEIGLLGLLVILLVLWLWARRQRVGTLPHIR
jgi:hypothetical protein